MSSLPTDKAKILLFSKKKSQMHLLFVQTICTFIKTKLLLYLCIDTILMKDKNDKYNFSKLLVLSGKTHLIPTKPAPSLGAFHNKN